MAKVRSWLLGLGFVALLAVNATSFLPHPRTTPNHPVGEDVVLATPFRPNADLRSVPVVETSGGTPVATGQRVHVFLSYAYEDALNQGRPRLSTWLLLGFGALYGLASLFARKKA
jgi:hypothetical protein